MRFTLVFLPFVLFACADSHHTEDASTPDASTPDASTPDASGVDAGPCDDDGPRPQCASSCDTTDVIPAICSEDAWRCPPGAVDVSTCSTGCPDGINPWDRDAPASLCSVPGATCSEGTQCGSAMFCTCESGSWNCSVAEPDPVCSCGREPMAGDPCTGEVETCGQCCPTAEGPNWSPMTCVDGAWQPASCADVLCAELLLECPVEIEPLLGEPCVHEEQLCGDPCCASVQCQDGIWQPGPELGCACFPSPPCGSGTCTLQQSCNSNCGPADGLEFRCVELPADCNSCECMGLQPGQTCEMIDGQVRVFEDEFCG